ncbi:hypothetical protein BDV32DRAFT_154684 [Aspergillus pseudonomiae]|uniref:Uncharacterized protein n=1 Tax=Aspergillus pseudonomiae TaxID=1506151 RepID=A0A5N6HKH7_9EURO|nr:uncharacterized protein BDV37DRAFT_288464 [Aspergillus pseudonomiae]KAB8255021.1 hypothetical protein BDV32DRAFT_154684 [Aspergillus pseudonomiae]KAE8398480.1 hypothetical protein BDV37DRAFT_288464 [Aspergillus pseudonomiae]
MPKTYAMRLLFQKNELNQVTTQWEKRYISDIAKLGGRVTRLNSAPAAAGTNSFIYHVTMPDKSAGIETVKFGPKRLEKLGKLEGGWIVPDK